MNYDRLNRVTYGPTETSVKELENLGWEKWVKEQLNPTEEDPEVDKRAKAFKAKIEYDGSNYSIAFDRYYQPAKELWKVTQRERLNQFEVHRPFYESIAYSWIKQRYSKWQLKEIMVEFWHNHFNVSGEADEAISLLFPVYDRDVIRKHTFGNFRKFLEDVAKSPCMLYYLDNVHSKASPANENYARELMELHTMGEDAYVNHLYKSWKEVPGALDGEGKVEGFIDEDIYEIARAFTGWTVGNNSPVVNTDPSVPATGEFYYNERWHDNYQKRIFGKEFSSHRGAMKDGLDVLDMVAFHPATTKFLCTKICRWLISDHPPKSIIDKAMHAWENNFHSDFQINHVIQVILDSKEFEDHLGSKIKRPNILMMSFFRAINMDFTPFSDYYWYLGVMGYKQYNWGPPTGQPDDSDYWVNSDMLLKRWNTFAGLVYADESYDEVQFDLPGQTPEITTTKELIQFWAKRILGEELKEDQVKPLADALWHDVDYETTMGEIRKKHPKWYGHKLRKLVGLLGCAPEFQKR
jgi:uncharacterized protein (DUF1800 family)